MDMEERKQVQDAFRKSHRALVSTDAGGEGLNLQFAHVIINYDIPWNPMRLEQRIGRVDRIGQPKKVRAINFVFENSIEFRVREVLEQKLSVIFNEFGIDKTGDVLDSTQAGELFEAVFTKAVVNPDGIEATVDHTMARIRDESLRLCSRRLLSTLMGSRQLLIILWPEFAMKFSRCATLLPFMVSLTNQMYRWLSVCAPIHFPIGRANDRSLSQFPWMAERLRSHPFPHW